MLSKLKQFFADNFTDLSLNPGTDEQIKLATAALFIEVMLLDGELQASEKLKISEILQSQFLLSEDKTAELYGLAEAEIQQATDYHQFTHFIARQFSQAEKISLIENLWSIAYADHHLDKYEEHMIRRIADLIHVSHKDFMQAKFRARDKLQKQAGSSS